MRWIGRPWLLAVILGMVLILATPLAAQASSVSTYAYDAATIPGTATTARATDPTIRSVETPAGDSGFVYDFYVNGGSGPGSRPCSKRKVSRARDPAVRRCRCGRGGWSIGSSRRRCG